MSARSKLLTIIHTKIAHISGHQLKDVLDFVEKIEQMNDQKKQILSFAGSWKDMDDDIFSELTDELPEMRLKESITE